MAIAGWILSAQSLPYLLFLIESKSESGAGPSSQPLGASADSVLPRHPASQGGGVRRACPGFSLRAAASSGLKAMGEA